jgi:hypothetical protein
MTDWTLSIVMIIPAALQDKANKLACALGHDVLPGNTFSAPLSSDGSEPATHYGCRTAAKQEFLDILTAAGAGQLPPALPLDEFGVTAQDIADVLAAQIIDVRDASAMIGHFDIVLAANDLQHVGTRLP